MLRAFCFLGRTGFYVPFLEKTNLSKYSSISSLSDAVFRHVCQGIPYCKALILHWGMGVDKNWKVWTENEMTLMNSFTCFYSQFFK